jgi:hypothetical protein
VKVGRLQWRELPLLLPGRRRVSAPSLHVRMVQASLAGRIAWERSAKSRVGVSNLARRSTEAQFWPLGGRQ